MKRRLLSLASFGALVLAVTGGAAYAAKCTACNAPTVDGLCKQVHGGVCVLIIIEPPPRDP